LIFSSLISAFYRTRSHVGGHQTNMIYIGGYGRSGSTILSILLSHASDAFLLGEFGLFFEQDEFDARAEGLAGHPFWDKLLAARGDARLTGPDALKVARAGSAGPSGFLSLLFRRHRAFETYIARVDTLIATALPRSVHTVIDSSKTARHFSFRPFFLKRTKAERLRVIHLSRNPFDVVNSITRFRHVERGTVRPRIVALRAATGWASANFWAGVFGLIWPNSYYFVEFENLIQKPEETMIALAAFLNINLDATIEKLRCDAPIPIPLMFGGNRLKKQSAIRIDKAHHLSNSTTYWAAGSVLKIALVLKSFVVGCLDFTLPRFKVILRNWKNA
jgi:hypothetical protein